MNASNTGTPTTLYELSPWFSHVEFSGASYETTDTKAAAFETQNGESIIAYYNRACSTEYRNQEAKDSNGNVYGFPTANMCVNFIYDLNGSKGPNTVGKDIGIITVFNATDSIVVAPMPSNSENTGHNTWYEAAKICTNADSETRLPNIDELSAMFINRDIVNLSASSQAYWSSTVYDSSRALSLFPQLGRRASGGKNSTANVRCVKR